MMKSVLIFCISGVHFTMLFSLSPKRNTLNFLEEIKSHHTIDNGIIVVAWARIAGVRLLHRAIGEHLANVDILVGVSDGATSAEAIYALLKICKSVHIFDDAAALTFHPKVYLFTDKADQPAFASIQVGSSNLTAGGLVTNYEANIELQLQPSSNSSENEFLGAMKADLGDLWKTEFARPVKSLSDIEALLDEGVLSAEISLRRKSGAKIQSKSGNAQRKKSKRVPIPFHELPFEVPAFSKEDSGTVPKVETPFTVETTVVPDTETYDVFVRTLTNTDIGKLRGDKGTLEPDLTVFARNLNKDFWGWPAKFKEVTNIRVTRSEWDTQAILRTSEDQLSGAQIVGFKQWFREQREGHAAEHRFQLYPIAKIRDVAPDKFDTDSLIVFRRTFVEQIPYEVFFVLPTEANYPYYSAIASNQRPKHRFGYKALLSLSEDE